MTPELFIAIVVASISCLSIFGTIFTIVIAAWTKWDGLQMFMVGLAIVFGITAIVSTVITLVENHGLLFQLAERFFG